METARSRIVVLGAGGFIGRRIVTALTASDWAQPVAAVRMPGKRRDDGIEIVAVDACSKASLAIALSGAAGIVNAIAGDAETIVSNARALFGLAATLPDAPRVVHLSTMSVYGSAIGVLTEQAPLLGDLDTYSAAKTQAELLGRDCPNVVSLRPGIVYGPESPLWSGLIGDFLMAKRLGALGPAGDGRCNLVHVDDVAAAVVLALKQPGISGSAFNLSTPAVPTWNDYFRDYAAALGALPLRTIAPARLKRELRLIGPLLKIAEMAFGPGRLPPPIRPWLTRLCAHDISLDVQRAEQLLGLRFMPLASGLAQTAAWFHSSRNGAS